MNDIVQRIRARSHDAHLDTEYMLDDAAEEIERLREALQFYAAEETYQVGQRYIPIHTDKGTIARTALEAAKNEKKG